MGNLCNVIGVASDWSWNWEAILRLLVASGLGAAIGIEREHHGRSAGFRTQLLVALGAALAMVVSLSFGRTYGNLPDSPGISVDPARMAYGVMAGIGFLGAGAIIRYGSGIRGLTTAASLWCTAAVGLACGFGMFIVATAAAAIVIFALLILSKFDRLIPSRWYKSVTVTLRASPENNVERFTGILTSIGAKVVDVEYTRDRRGDTEVITYHVTMPSRSRREELMKIGSEVKELISLTIK